MNINLPVAGSGDFSRLSIISTASRRSYCQSEPGRGWQEQLWSSHDLEERGFVLPAPFCPGSLSDLTGADCLLLPEPSAGDPAQPLLTVVCPDLYTSALTTGLLLPHQHLSQTGVSWLHAAQPEGIWHSTRRIKVFSRCVVGEPSPSEIRRPCLLYPLAMSCFCSFSHALSVGFSSSLWP